MRVVNLVFSVLFLLSAVVQYNDPDPLVWIAIYLFGALMCFMAFKRIFYPKAYMAGIAIYSVYALYLFFVGDGVADWLIDHDAESIAGTMQAQRPWVEATREFFGLLILITALVMNLFYSKRKYTKEIRERVD